MSKKSEKTEKMNTKESDQADAGQEFMDEVLEAVDDSVELTLEQQLEAAKEEVQHHKESFLLASAEAENIRKRTQNEMVAARKFAVEKFAGELLSVRDSLDLASATEIDEADSEVVKKMREGLELTLKQLDAVFEKFNISVIHPKGEKFNPDHHQAMTAVESQDIEPNHVLAVMQKGYLLNDRLLRPAMVVVSKAPTEDSGE